MKKNNKLILFIILVILLLAGIWMVVYFVFNNDNKINKTKSDIKEEEKVEVNQEKNVTIIDV